jgi:hypothetical protein
MKEIINSIIRFKEKRRRRRRRTFSRPKNEKEQCFINEIEN